MVGNDIPAKRGFAPDINSPTPLEHGTTLSLDKARTLIGKNITALVILDEKYGVKLEKQEESWAGGVVDIVEQDKQNPEYWWIVFDWGWGLRIDAIVEWNEEPLEIQGS